MQDGYDGSMSLAALAATQKRNHTFFRLLADYLNHAPRLVTEELIHSLVTSCHVLEEEAFCAILSAAFGWEEEEREEDRCLFHEYLRPAVRKLQPSAYQTDPYYSQIRIGNRTNGKWRLQTAHYEPFEGFVCGPLCLGPHYATRPAIGYFAERFSYPMVLENGVEWMAIKPNEIETMRRPIADAHGRVLTFGLGLGYFAYMAARKEEVCSVTVVEREADVIHLFQEEILPQFASLAGKIEIIEADAFAFAASRAACAYDYVFCDLWHDAADGLPLYIRMRKIEKAQQNAPFAYWIEDMLLSELRSMVYGGLWDEGRCRVSTKEAYHMLSDAYLRALAPDLRAVQETEEV